MSATRFRGVEVITSVLHTEGPRFDPGRKQLIPRGVVASISGFHPEDPGSTPGMGSFWLLF